MNKKKYDKILKAIEGSIEKWINIRDNGGFDKGRKNCPLCQLFNKRGSCTSEYGECPVADFVCEEGCGKTPYVIWAIHKNAHTEHETRVYQKVYCDHCKFIANKEVEFLLRVKKDFVEKNKKNC